MGEETAGVRRGANNVMSSRGKAANVCMGEGPGQLMIGGVSFSMTVYSVRRDFIDIIRCPLTVL